MHLRLLPALCVSFTFNDRSKVSRSEHVFCLIEPEVPPVDLQGISPDDLRYRPLADVGQKDPALGDVLLPVGFDQGREVGISVAFMEKVTY